MNLSMGKKNQVYAPAATGSLAARRVGCGGRVSPVSSQTRISQRGFSLVELSVVLVVIGLIISAVTITSSIQRTAEYNSLFTRFVSGWSDAYQTYFDYTGTVPGDSVPASGKVNQGTSELCGNTLRTTIANIGIELPQGRGRGYENLATYIGSDGSTQQLTVCFSYVSDWTTSAGTKPSNVMKISGVTAELASKLDALVDINSDAAWGDLRSADHYTDTGHVSWPVAVNPSTEKLNKVTVYYRMPY